MASRLNSFRTKFILAAGVGVFVGLTLNVFFALNGLRKLEDASSGEIEKGLTEANIEYLSNHIEDKARATNRMLDAPMKDLKMLADITQELFDNKAKLGDFLKVTAQSPIAPKPFTYNPQGGWSQTPKGYPTAIAAWGYLLDPDTHVVNNKTQRAIDQTALLDLMLPVFQRNGADKLQMYYVGPKTQPFVRLAPYLNMGEAFDQLYPGHNKKLFWEFFFPGLVDGWEAWLRDAETLNSHGTEITITEPYEDAAGGGLVMTFFHPLWNKERTRFEGAIGLDLTLAQIIASIEGIQLAETGFAFLVQSNGNVLAVPDSGENLLGIAHANDPSKLEKRGVSVLERNLGSSSDPAVAALKDRLTSVEDNHIEDVTIGGEHYILATRRLSKRNFWTGEIGSQPEAWTLGFLLPRDEVYASLFASQASISSSNTKIITGQIAIAFGTLILVLLGIVLISRRITASLVELSKGAQQIANKNYEVKVEVITEDEIGQLATTFNFMAQEIREYMHNLENLVRVRTAELEQANEEILSLNARLKADNVRMSAELDVARQLQLMVLPHPEELAEIRQLDIAGYMAPADEVGGDYYDVLRSAGGIKLAIGDVTGHGLESGVLMLMVQTAVRTLLLSEEKDPRRFLNIVNKVVYQNVQRIETDRNLSLSLLDYSNQTLRLTGQHEEVLVVRADGTCVERVDTMELGLPVGIEFDISDFIADLELRLESGDLVVLFTDGITEAENMNNEQYGIDRLCAAILREHRQNAKQIRQAVIEDVMAFIGSQKVYDDITLVILKQR
ncbi:MAG: SpoIIE family protein phosphatase [Nannocystaceae bacterium]